MAIVKCPECGKDISDSAVSCPNCGKPLQQPSTISPNPAPQKKKTGIFKKILISIAVIFVGLIVLGMIVGDDKNESSSGTGQQQTSEPTVTSQPNETLQIKKMVGFNMTPTQIANSMNHYYKIAEFKPPINKIEKFKSYDGAINDVYFSNFSENTGIQFVTPKNEKNVISLNIISVPKSNEDSLYLMLSIGTVIATLSPHLNKDERGKVLFELLNNKNGGLNDNKSIIIKNIKYTFNASKEVGILFFAENNDDL